MVMKTLKILLVILALFLMTNCKKEEPYCKVCLYITTKTIDNSIVNESKPEIYCGDHLNLLEITKPKIVDNLTITVKCYDMK